MSEMVERFEAEKKRIIESGMLESSGGWDRVCVSILSDAQEDYRYADEKINFVKFLLVTKNDK